MYQPARRIAFFAILVSAFVALGLSAPATAAIPYNQMASSEARYASIVVDANTGEVLFARHADSPRYPASITKVMTLYLAFEAMSQGRLRQDDLITVSSKAASQSPTKLGLRAGDTIRVDDALRAIAVKSANDMAVAMAEHLGGSESRFAALMTLRAQELGMTTTRFTNASGLPDSRQVSSARDIAILSRSVMRDYPQYYSYFGQRQFTYRGSTMRNHNHLLNSMPGVDGLKTGFTNASGYNLAASAVQNGRRLIAVVMGGNTGSSRNSHVEELLRTGFTVMARRDRGEVIQVAQNQNQNLFEPDPMGLSRPVYAQGDEDSQRAPERGLRIIVTDQAPKAYRVIGPSRAEQGLLIPAPAQLREPKIIKAADERPAKAETNDCRTVTRAVTEPVKGKKARKAKPVTRMVKVRVCKSDNSEKLNKAALTDKPVRKGPRGGELIRANEVRKVKPRGDWMVQVGAFKDRASAKTQLSKVGKTFASQFAEAEGRVEDAVGGLFRARYVGMTAVAAKAACSAIKAKGQSCLVVTG